MKIEQLIARARDGDDKAVHEILETLRPMMRCIAHGLIDDCVARADSSDLIQDTMTRAYIRFPEFRGATRGELVAWLKAILANEVVRYRRYHYADKRNVDREHQQVESDPDVGSPDDPAAGMLELERRAKLARAVEELPDDMQKVVYARIFDEESFDDISERLNKSANTLRVTWCRAVQRLTAILNDASQSSLGSL